MMTKKKPDSSKTTRYSNSVINYKSLSCRASIYEDRLITDFCNKHKMSKSIFLTAAAMYCVKNDISAEVLLNSTTTSDNFDFKDYMKNEYDG